MAPPTSPAVQDDFCNNQDLGATKPRRITSQERRVQISELATDLYIRHGVGNVSPRRIAREARISEGLVYRNFRSNEQIFEEAALKPLERLLSSMIDLCAQPAPAEDRGSRERELLKRMREITPLLGAVAFLPECGDARFAQHRLLPLLQRAAGAAPPSEGRGSVRHQDRWAMGTIILGTCHWLSLIETLSGVAKSDAGDAYLLADVLRTDGHRLTPLAQDSDATRVLRALSRTRNQLVEARVGMVNQRAQLELVFPGAIGLFARLDSDVAIAFLSRYPSAHAAHRLTEARLAAFLRRISYSGRKPVSELHARLRDAPAAGLSPTEADGHATCVLSLLRAIRTVHRAPCTVHRAPCTVHRAP